MRYIDIIFVAIQLRITKNNSIVEGYFYNFVNI